MSVPKVIQDIRDLKNKISALSNNLLHITSTPDDNVKIWIDPSEDGDSTYYTTGDVDTLLAGKAPAGYGLGESQGRHVANASVDTLTKNGWYYLYDGVTGGPSGYSIYHATLFVSSSRSDLTKVQRLILATSGLQGYELRRVYNDTAWLPWEWVNPPMVVGTEYRTTERYLGKPVYVKLIDFGAGANNAEKSVEHGASNAIVIDYGGYAKSSSTTALSVPWKTHSTLSASDTVIVMTSNADYSGYSVYVWIKYYKTTD